MLKPAHTLLLITRQVLARVDLTAGKAPQVRKTWLRPRFESESIATLVDATLRLGPRRAGKVWVLSTDFWNGVVALPPDVTAMLAGSDLEQSVALEAESYSGISAFDSRVGSRRLADDSHGDARYWATQISSVELSEIENAVRACGATWGGAAHPAVMIPPLCEDAAAWQAVQAWGETTLASRGRGTVLDDLAILGGRLDAAGTRLELAHWQAAAPDAATTWISDIGVAAELVEPSDAAIRVDQEAGLAPWAAAWGRSLAESNAVPLVRAVKRPMSQERQMFLAASLGLLAIGLCVGHNTLVRGHLDAADASVKQLEEQKKRLTADKKTLADLSKRNQATEQAIAKTQAQRVQLEQGLVLAERAIDQQRNRWVQLIDALLETSNNSSWVQRMEGKSKTAVIHGMAINDATANRFASDLEAAARREGWAVRPARTTLAPNSLTEFTIALEVVPPTALGLQPEERVDELLTGTTVSEATTTRRSRRAR